MLIRIPQNGLGAPSDEGNYFSMRAIMVAPTSRGLLLKVVNLGTDLLQEVPSLSHPTIHLRSH
jgi:hypothetical protein